MMRKRLLRSLVNTASPSNKQEDPKRNWVIDRCYFRAFISAYKKIALDLSGPNSVRVLESSDLKFLTLLSGRKNLSREKNFNLFSIFSKLASDKNFRLPDQEENINLLF